MNYRLKGIRVSALLLTMGIIAVLGLSLQGCGGGGGGSSSGAGTIQLSGAIVSNGSYTFGKVFKGISFAPGPITIDKVVAIPMNRGSLDARNMTSRVTGTIGADGTFDLTLPKDKDWLLVLIDSPSTFVGSLAIDAGSDSLLSLPATVSTLSSLNLGTITGTGFGGGGDAISSAATVTASNFGMTPAQLAAMAKSDDVFKNARNIINNFDTATGIWYQLRPDFTWHGDYATIMSGVFSGPTWTYHSYNFQMDTNATNLTIDNLCSGASFTPVGWTPPSDVTDGITTYGTTTPITNSAATCTTYLSDGVPATQASGGNFYATDAYWGPSGTISYSLPIWFQGAIPTGAWTWKENGVIKATFDPSVSTPVHTDGVRSLGYVPSIRLTVNGSNVITAVDVEWYYFDGSAYQPVTTAADLAVMSHLMDGYEIILESGNVLPRRHSSFRLDPTIASELHLALPATGPDSWTLADNDSGTAFLVSDAGSVGVFYSSGGIGRYFFDFAAN